MQLVKIPQKKIPQNTGLFVVVGFVFKALEHDEVKHRMVEQWTLVLR